MRLRLGWADLIAWAVLIACALIGVAAYVLIAWLLGQPVEVK